MRTPDRCVRPRRRQAADAAHFRLFRTLLRMVPPGVGRRRRCCGDAEHGECGEEVANAALVHGLAPFGLLVSPMDLGAIPSRVQYRFVRIAIRNANGRDTEGRVAPLAQGNPRFPAALQDAGAQPLMAVRAPILYRSKGPKGHWPAAERTGAIPTTGRAARSRSGPADTLARNAPSRHPSRTCSARSPSTATAAAPSSATTRRALPGHSTSAAAATAWRSRAISERRRLRRPRHCVRLLHGRRRTSAHAIDAAWSLHPYPPIDGSRGRPRRDSSVAAIDTPTRHAAARCRFAPFRRTARRRPAPPHPLRPYRPAAFPRCLRHLSRHPRRTRPRPHVRRGLAGDPRRPLRNG